MQARSQNSSVSFPTQNLTIGTLGMSNSVHGERQSGFQFRSSLLKKSLIEMHKTPTTLPPRYDMRRHIDKEEQDEAMEGVMDGVNEPAPGKRSRPKQIDPRINPDGVCDYDSMLMRRRAELRRQCPKRSE